MFDFETTGIPYDPNAYDIKSLQEPCRVIGSLQISRDLRNDGGVQLSSLLASMPSDVRAACTRAAQEGDDFTIDDATARDFERRTDATLITRDLDLDLQNIQSFRTIVESQRAARRALIYALIQTRCRFGAKDAAEAFLAADRSMAEYNKRKQILLDAMDLEGLDPEEEEVPTKKKKAAGVEVLPPLAWYKPDGELGPEPKSKRARMD
jgi:hypothetical protein